MRKVYYNPTDGPVLIDSYGRTVGGGEFVHMDRNPKIDAGLAEGRLVEAERLPDGFDGYVQGGGEADEEASNEEDSEDEPMSSAGDNAEGSEEEGEPAEGDPAVETAKKSASKSRSKN